MSPCRFVEGPARQARQTRGTRWVRRRRDDLDLARQSFAVGADLRSRASGSQDGSTNFFTCGVLLADYLAAILTGHHLPADLAQEASNSPFVNQYDPHIPSWVRNPSVLPGTDLTIAFVAT